MWSYRKRVGSCSWRKSNRSCKATKINIWKNNRCVTATRIAQNAFASLRRAVHERINYLSIKSATIFYLLYESHYRLTYRATFNESQCSWSFMENSAKRTSNNSSPLQRRFSVLVGGLFSSWMTSQLLRTIAHCRHRPTRLSLSEDVFEEFLVIKPTDVQRSGSWLFCTSYACLYSLFQSI